MSDAILIPDGGRIFAPGSRRRPAVVSAASLTQITPGGSSGYKPSAVYYAPGSATSKPTSLAAGSARARKLRAEQAEKKVAAAQKVISRQAQDIQDFVASGGYKPVATNVDVGGGTILFERTRGGKPERVSLEQIRSKMFGQQFENYIKDAGWKQELNVPGSRDEDLWVQYDPETGEPVDYATWDELSNPQSRADARAYAQRKPPASAPATATTGLEYGAQQLPVVIEAANMAYQETPQAVSEQAAEQALQSMFSGMGGYAPMSFSWLKSGGVLVAAGLLLYVVHRLRRKGRRVRRNGHG